MADLLSSRQVAESLGVSVQQITAWVRKGMPREKSKRFNSDHVQDWLIKSGLAYKDGEKNPHDFAPDEHIERTIADCGRAVGVNERTIQKWLRMDSFPGFSGDPGQRNGMFPIRKIKAWMKHREATRPVNQYDNAGKSDQFRDQLNEIKLEREQLRLQELKDEVVALPVALAEAQRAHSAARQVLYKIPAEVISVYPPGTDQMLIDNVKARVVAMVDRASTIIAEYVEGIGE